MTPNVAPLLTRRFGGVGEFKSAEQRRKVSATVTGIVATAILGLLYIVASGNLIVPLVPILLVALVVLIWRRPGVLLPITVSSACIFELQPMGFADALTDHVPLFWDVNTIVQIYGHVNFHGIAINFYEVMLILGCVAGGLKAVFSHRVGMKGGALIAPMSAYLVCVLCGVLHGLGTGGAFSTALFEVRAQVYVFVAYLIVLNCGQDAQDAARTALWATIISIGFKGVLLSFRYVFTLGGHTVADQGVGAHEESFFFDIFALLYLVLKMGNVEPKMRRAMLWLLPFVLLANLANMRRTATGALIVAIPVLLYLSYVAFANRRKFIVKLTVGLAAVIAVYLPAFWNSDGTMGQPARAVRSHFDPDPRDQSSDLYRLEEDENLMATMRTDPVFGYGYGKPIILAVPMADLSQSDPLIFYLTHDQILWVWMRLGTVGFIVFWIMIANWLVRSSQAAADPKLIPLARVIGVFTAVVVASLLMFGLYDMQLANMRDMLITGTFLGVTAALLRQRNAELRKLRQGARTDIFHGHASQYDRSGTLEERDEPFRESVLVAGLTVAAQPRLPASPLPPMPRHGRQPDLSPRKPAFAAKARMPREASFEGGEGIGSLESDESRSRAEWPTIGV